MEDIVHFVIDEAKRSPYKISGEIDKLLERIIIRADGGDIIDLKEYSEVVDALSNFKFERVYYDHCDAEIRKKFN